MAIYIASLLFGFIRRLLFATAWFGLPVGHNLVNTQLPFTVGAMEVHYNDEHVVMI
jgi:uncharacterized membrane protein (DUF485 family)